MTNKRANRDEPEPIEAEFEPANGAPEPARPKRKIAPPPMRSRSASLPELLIASIAASALGALVAIIVSNASSGAPTGTLAREIDTLSRTQTELAARADQAAGDIVTMRTKLDAQADRLAQQDAAEGALRGEISTIASQVSALAGAGDGKAAPGATAAATPLGALLARINKLEEANADANASPRTQAQVQRAITDLSNRVTALNEANATLAAALDKRQAALTALEAGMQTLNTDLATHGAQVDGAQVAAATGESRTLRALSALETTAQKGMPFVEQQQVLAALVPQDQSVAALAELARRGAPTLDQLRRDFDAAVLTADQPDDGWNWLRTAFVGVVDFKAAPASPADADLFRKARRALEAGDAHGAVTAVDRLSANTGGLLRSWRDQAARRADLDQKLKDLNARLAGSTATPNRDG